MIYGDHGTIMQLVPFMNLTKHRLLKSKYLQLSNLSDN